jgi:hypothetical protein
MISANIDRTLQAIKQAVTDLRALIRWLKNRGKTVIIIGISLGGLITNLTGVVEKQIDAMAAIFFADNLANSVWQTIPGKYIKKDLEQHGITHEQLRKWWDITVPSNFKPLIPQNDILLLSGKHDRYMLREDTILLWESWGKPAMISYPCGHAGIVLYKNSIVQDTLSFVENKIITGN